MISAAVRSFASFSVLYRCSKNIEIPNANSISNGTQMRIKPFAKIVLGKIRNALLLARPINGQAEPKCASLAFLRFQSYLAAVQLDYLLAYWQAQTGASFFRCVSGGYLPEALKNCLAQMSGHPSACITNSHLHLVIYSIGADHHRGSRG